MKSKTKNNLGPLKNLVNNKYVLYVVSLIALLDIIGFILRQEFSSVLLFYLVGMITFYYTKNMTIVLAVPLFVTSLVYFLKKAFNMKEGMNTKEGHGKKDKGEKRDRRPADARADLAEEAEEEEEMERRRRAEEERKRKEEELEKRREATVVVDEEVMTNNQTVPNLKSGYQNQIKLRPGEFNIPNKEQLAKQLGKADKMEQSYDNLEKVIGDNGIKSMSSSTKELVRQQKELVKGLKEVTPALNEAMGAIGKIDMGGLSKLFSSVNFGGGNSDE